MLNVGCGLRMHNGWTNLDFSPYARLARYRGAAALARRVGLLSERRFARLQSVDTDILVWDIRRGLPFKDDTLDVVYHSHTLEHLPRGTAPTFLNECRRVLRSGGVLRVVVPDLQELVASYVGASTDLEKGGGDWAAYDDAVDAIFEQIVRSETAGATLERRCVRWLERVLRGSPERTGEIHRWMYDRHSLGRLLEHIGYQDIRVCDVLSSGIEGFRDFHLDTHEDGSPHKVDSLYMEARK
jgi:SAM-dependent methyltransferase